MVSTCRFLALQVKPLLRCTKMVYVQHLPKFCRCKCRPEELQPAPLKKPTQHTQAAQLTEGDHFQGMLFLESGWRAALKPSPMLSGPPPTSTCL
jgi:hypothetical protein